VVAEIVRVLPAGTMEGVSIEAHLDAAAATGFDAVSLRPRHPERLLGALLARGWSGPVAVEVLGEAGEPLQRAARAADALDVMLGATDGWADA
jgi:hypothetical protein